MPGTMEYIESYFQQTLSDEEKAAFEARCGTDEMFAKEVAFYITTRQLLREELLVQKQKQWKEQDLEEEETPVVSIKRKTSFIGWVSYAAAACLLLAVSVFLFETQNSPGKLAANYIKTEYTTLSQEMSANTDSITLGLEAYNNKEYDKALGLLEGVEQRDPTNSDVKKYTGLAYLQKEDYDNAVQQFDELANMNLHSNPGHFLKAMALLERNKPGDKEEAKTLLQKVVNENEEHSKEAAEWLKKF